MNTDIKKWIAITEKAIKETGKSFTQIPKHSILEFLQDNGITDKNFREQVYSELSKNNLVKVPITKDPASKPNLLYPSKGPSYMENDSKPKKEPRKSVFGDIKRIA
jgi:hypothetical protein